MRGFFFSLFALIVSLGIGVIVCGEIGNGIGNVRRDDFPDGFVFGAASSAYQTEVAANQDGRTPCIWDTFAKAGHMKGATGDIACDGYHKYKEDVRLMAETGLEAYRFSISWSRLFPRHLNPKGVVYYNNFIDELISYGIQPHVTLVHSDHPQILEDKYGGWVNQKIVEDCMEYADVCFREFGDRVKLGLLLMSPIYLYGQVMTRDLYHLDDVQFHMVTAPKETPQVSHTLQLIISCWHTHWLIDCMKKNYKDKQQGFVRFNILSHWPVPLTDNKKDEIATKRAKVFFIDWFLNPLVFGDYPDLMKKNAGSRIPAFTIQESESIRGSFDFLGLNYYFVVNVKDKSAGNLQ